MKIKKELNRDELAFLEGKTFEQAVMLIDKLDLDYNVCIYSVDRIMTEEGSKKSRGGFNPMDIKVRIKEGRIFEVLGRG